jgi:uncharacterized protein YecE (DUF72 family)
MHPVRVGTCGWSYKEWACVFYPDGLPAADWLAYYAEHFPVVEVDATFYRSPSRKAVEAWRDRTSPGFGFSLKVPQAITHEKVLLDCRDELAAFLGAARLGVSLQTVKLHRGRLMRKLQLRSVPELVRLAEKAGSLPPSH